MANQGPYYSVGAYVTEVVEQAIGRAKTGTPQFILRFKVMGTPVPDSDSYNPSQQQYERTMYMALTEATKPYVMDNLERLGFRGGSILTLDPGHAQHQSFVGQMVDMYCKHETGTDGQNREKWQMSRGGGGMKVEPLAQKEARELDALFGRSAVKTASRPVPSQAPPPQYQDDSQITDDDIPF